MTAIRTTSVTIANAGDTTITVNDGVDFSEVVPSSSIQIDGIAANLIIDSGTEPVDGVSTLTLRTGYPAGLALPTAYAATITIGSNAFKNMTNQLKTQVDYVSDSAKTVSDYGSTNNASFSWPAIDGSSTTVKTPLAMQAEVDTITADANNLVNALGLSTEADFTARRELAKSDPKRIGSGVVHAGLGVNWSDAELIGDGLYTKIYSALPNTVFLSGAGVSGGSNPVLDFDGVRFEIEYLNFSDDNCSLVNTPEAITPTVEATAYRYTSNTVTVGAAATYNAPNAGGTVEFDVSAATGGLGVQNIEFNNLGATHWIVEGDNGNKMVISRVSSATDYVNWPFSDNDAYLYGSGDVAAEFNAKFPIGTVLTLSAIVPTPTTQDYSVHDWIVQDNNAYCCIADSTTGDLLTDTTKFRHSPEGVVRENLAAAEAFLVPLTGTGKRPFYPRGLVQNAQSSYGGVTMSATSGLGISGVDAGYCRFGEWDSSTDGLGCDFESLTSAQKVNLGILEGQRLFVGSDGVVYQWHLRAKVFRGFGCGWLNFEPESTAGNDYVRFSGAVDMRIYPQGNSNESNELATNANSFYAKSTRTTYMPENMPRDNQIFIGNSTPIRLSANGIVMLMPLFLHTQGNTGGHHKFLNEFGHRIFAKSGFGYSVHWKDSDVTNLNECFQNFDVGGVGVGYSNSSGFIAATTTIKSGRDDGKFYDAVYPEQIRSLRNLTHNPEKTVNGLSYEAVSNDIRGWQGMPKLHRFSDNTVTVGVAATYSSVNNSTISFVVSAATNGLGVQNSEFSGRNPTHWLVVGDNGNAMSIKRVNTTDAAAYWPYSANNTAYLYGSGDVAAEFNSKFPVGTVLTLGAMSESAVTVSGEYSHTDFIGSPENIKTIMDSYGVDYVYGQWIPTIPDGTSKEFKATEKIISENNQLYSLDGTIWQTSTLTFTTTTNSMVNNMQDGRIQIANYTAYANGWQSASRGSVDNAELSDVTLSNSALASHGSVICSHFFGDVPTGESNPRVLQGYKVRDFHVNPTAGGILQTYNLTHDTPTAFGSLVDGFKFASYFSTDDNGITTRYAMPKQLKYDASLDNGAEFTDVSEANATWTAETYYHITDGRFEGYWYALTGNNSDLTGAGWYEEGGYIRNSSGTAVFKKWDGNGWSDNDQIEVVDGVTVIESESPDIYVQVGTFSHKDPLNRV